MADTGATLRQVVFDIMGDFKQVHADAEITPFKMTYWVLVHADRLRKLHIQKIDSGEYLSLFDVTVVNGTRKYITLPARVYDFDLDKGVAFVSYTQISSDKIPTFAQVTFGRTTPAGAKILQYREEEMPGPDNPYIYRVGDKLYLLGVEDVVIPEVEIGLYTTLKPSDLTLDLDQPFDFPQDLIPTLKRQVLDLGLFAMQVPKDVLNDGAATPRQLPQKKFISVNELNQQQ